MTLDRDIAIDQGGVRRIGSHLPVASGLGEPGEPLVVRVHKSNVSAIYMQRNY